MRRGGAKEASDLLDIVRLTRPVCWCRCATRTFERRSAVAGRLPTARAALVGSSCETVSKPHQKTTAAAFNRVDYTTIPGVSWLAAGYASAPVRGWLPYAALTALTRPSACSFSADASPPGGDNVGFRRRLPCRIVACRLAVGHARQKTRSDLCRNGFSDWLVRCATASLRSTR